MIEVPDYLVLVLMLPHSGGTAALEESTEPKHLELGRILLTEPVPQDTGEDAARSS